MGHFVVEPLVAGQLGSGSVLDPSCHPPAVSEVEYLLDAPTSEDLIESFPVFLVSEQMAARLKATDMSGFEFAQASVVPSREYAEVYGEVPHKGYLWLRPVPAADPDCWVDDQHRLNVSERMLGVLRAGDIANALVMPSGASSTQNDQSWQNE